MKPFAPFAKISKEEKKIPPPLELNITTLL